MRPLKPIFLFLFFYALSISSALAAKVGPPDEPARLQNLSTVFSNILTVVSVLAAFASLAMIVFGGFRYIIAQGDPKAIQAARGTVTWAVAGLVVLVLSWLILLFISEFTGLPSLVRFCIGLSC